MNTQDNKSAEVINPEDEQLEGNVISAEENEIEILKAECEELRSQAEESKKQYLRALADYHNLEKRVREEKMEFLQIAQARVISQLFPVLDNLDQAEVFIKDPGLKMVKDSFLQSMNELGVTEIELLGKEYDPHNAEVVDVVPGDEDDMVVEVVKRGYEINKKVLRPGLVKVSKKA